MERGGKEQREGKREKREGTCTYEKMQTQRPYVITDSNLIADGRLY